MPCEERDHCHFYKCYRNTTTGKQYLLLIESYCEGQLKAKCRRLKWVEQRQERPPTALCPNGYLVGAAKKFYD